MLRGIVGQKEISKERLEAKKEQIQEQALKRFTENASKRDSDLEKMKNFQLLHVQCVGVGLIAAAYLSMQRGLLTEEEYEEIRKGCHSYNLPLSVDSLNAGDVLAATKKDKKMEAGHIKFILMDGIGKSFIDKTVTDEELLQAIREILI